MFETYWYIKQFEVMQNQYICTPGDTLEWTVCTTPWCRPHQTSCLSPGTPRPPRTGWSPPSASSRAVRLSSAVLTSYMTGQWTGLGNSWAHCGLEMPWNILSDGQINLFEKSDSSSNLSSIFDLSMDKRWNDPCSIIPDCWASSFSLVSMEKYE